MKAANTANRISGIIINLLFFYLQVKTMA